ncbi:Uncharacterised protein [Mycobacterium tuberculosis]|nr:Uncharacterised protein [Mycobacterium tuberculosis]COW91631.1 Uncharacterised protein [Mycobacterium tuberculosis]COX15445.1 Uncharacterised protein [Mycobacterium tuberculosis]COX49905.1 Uncharacterised protein [Mycobacterium tuberculosis]COY98483.1 Uncharacterised protein [Mycobacterium tuberculosis]
MGSNGSGSSAKTFGVTKMPSEPKKVRIRCTVKPAMATTTRMSSGIQARLRVPIIALRLCRMKFTPVW